MRIAVFGTGGMGRELADLVRRCRRSTNLVFVVDNPAGPVCGISVIPPTQLRSDDALVLAVGSSGARRILADRFSRQPFETIISDQATVSPFAAIGQGSVVCDFSVVNNGSKIGRHFQGNVYSQVSHDCVIGDFVTFGPRVTCNGWVEIGDGVTVGAGAVIRNGDPGRRLRIGAGAVIGMGAVVVGDIPAGATVIGVPARAR